MHDITSRANHTQDEGHASTGGRVAPTHAECACTTFGEAGHAPSERRGPIEVGTTGSRVANERSERARTISGGAKRPTITHGATGCEPSRAWGAIDGPDTEAHSYRGRETTGHTPEDGPFLGEGSHILELVTAALVVVGALLILWTLLGLA